jgi:hypothetical protein
MGVASRRKPFGIAESLYGRLIAFRWPRRVYSLTECRADKTRSKKDFVLHFRLSVVDSNLERRKPTLEIFGTVIGALPGFEFRFHAAVDDKCIAGARQFLNSRSVHSHTCADDFDPRFDPLYGESAQAGKRNDYGFVPVLAGCLW